VTALGRDPVVDALREQIAEADRELVALVNRRLQLVAELWAHKRTHGQPLSAPERERWLYEHLAEANAGPLSAGGLAELVAFVLELTKQELAQGEGTR
jgi:chorismate mutase